MTDFETIGQILNQAMQAGQVRDCGQSSTEEIVILSPMGEGFHFYFTFDCASGAALNVSLGEMKSALAESGIVA